MREMASYKLGGMEEEAIYLLKIKKENFGFFMK